MGSQMLQFDQRVGQNSLNSELQLVSSMQLKGSRLQKLNKNENGQGASAPCVALERSFCSFATSHRAEAPFWEKKRFEQTFCLPHRTGALLPKNCCLTRDKRHDLARPNKIPQSAILCRNLALHSQSIALKPKTCLCLT